MDDTEQMIVNELRRIDRAIERRDKALQAESNKDGMRTFPKRYVLDLSVDIPVTAEDVVVESQLNPVIRSFVVDRDCKRFFCKQVVASIIARGDVGASSVTATPPVNPFPLTDRVLDFLWKVRDTSTDREWSDYPLPSYVLPIEGLIGGYALPAPAVLDPGTEVEVSITPLAARRSLFPIQNISKISVLFSFVGFEVL